jgi:small subunit ribosomal protein S17
MEKKVESQTEKNSKSLQCLVISDKMDKTCVGIIERKVKHPLVGKYITRTTKLHFHDENNEAKTGDYVLIKQTRPMSKKKSFKLLKVTKHKNQVEMVEV